MKKHTVTRATRRRMSIRRSLLNTIALSTDLPYPLPNVRLLGDGTQRVPGRPQKRNSCVSCRQLCCRHETHIGLQAPVSPFGGFGDGFAVPEPPKWANL